MTLFKRLAAIVLAVLSVMGTAGTVNGSQPLSISNLVIFALMMAAAAVLWLSARKSERRERERSEVQKLLALVGDQGTLASPQLVAAGYTKEEADEALQRLRDSGVAQFDVDDTGTPVYRVHQAALEARKRKGW